MLSALPRRARGARLAARVALAVAALGAAGCGDGDDLVGPDVEIESVRLTVTPAGGAATIYTVTANSQNATPIALRVGANTIVAEPIGDDDQVSDEADEFELQFTGPGNSALPAGVTATRAGLTNTVTATAAVTTPADVAATMFHVAEDHGDYTANFRITVAP